ncbi:MAG: hypothetical protein RR280_07790 [Bacteroidaceae bacterium]
MIKIKISMATLLLTFQLSSFAQSELPKSALDYMLQKPKVVKTFEKKVLGDHLFLQAGFGPTMTFGGNDHFLKINTPAVQANLMIGDWITPEHGLRLGLNGGFYKSGEVKAKFVGVSLDYMMNLTALASPVYTTPRKFELYGIAGAEYQSSHNEGVAENVMGMRFGLQANARIGDCLHLFLEPRIGLYSDHISHRSTWRKYRPAASVLAGIGYNLITGEARHHFDSPYDDFLDGLFVSGALGGGALMFSDLHTMKDFKGVRAQASLGKWFDPYSAIRLTAKVETFQRNGKSKMKGVGGQLDYMLNFNNLFAGYCPDRWVDLYGIAGVGLNYTSGGAERQYSPAIGAGFQANFFLNRNHTFSFFVEPRIDVNGRKYIEGYNSASTVDATASVMAGFTLLRAPSSVKPRVANLTYPQPKVYNHWFIEGAGGLNSLCVSSLPSEPRSYLGPCVQLGAGRWLNATSGVRLSFEFSKYKHPAFGTNNLFGGSLDYLWNISNAVNGYVPNRHFELIGVVGANLATHSNRDRVFLGANIGAQALWNLNSMTSLYLEPQLRLYANNFAPGSCGLFKLDALGALMAGIRLNLNGYDAKKSREAFGKNDANSFAYMAGGFQMKPYQYHNHDYYGVVSSIGIGRWFTPLSAWRLSASGSEWKETGSRIARGAVTADYLLDLTTLAYGYNPQRAVSLRAFGGASIGLDYHRQNIYLTPLLRVGGQMGVRVSKQVELFLEPQLSKTLVRTNGSRSNHVDAALLLGLNYRMQPSHQKPRNTVGEQFVSIAGGLGLNSENVHNNPFHRKWVFDVDASYGRWVNKVSGMRFGISNEFIQKHFTHNKSWLSLHADYLLNLNALLNGGKPSGAAIQWIAALGVSGNAALQQDRSPRFAPGLVASVQADISITETISLFLEPTITVLGKRIGENQSHPFEAAAKLMIGTNIKF